MTAFPLDKEVVTLLLGGPHGQVFECDGLLAMVMTVETDFEVDSEFLEHGAGFLGAAAILDGETGQMGTEGWITLENIAPGSVQGGSFALA